MPSVRITGLEETIEVKAGASLLDACKENRINLFWGPWARAFNCRGIGVCNLCKVEVVEGAETLPPRTKHEAKRLGKKPQSWRLACELPVRGDMAIAPYPKIPVADRISPEALRRASLTPEQRQMEARDRAEARREAHQHDIEERRAARAARPGAIARLLKRGPKEQKEAKVAREKAPAKEPPAAPDAKAESKGGGRFGALRRGRSKQ